MPWVLLQVWFAVKKLGLNPAAFISVSAHSPWERSTKVVFQWYSSRYARLVFRPIAKVENKSVCSNVRSLSWGLEFAVPMSLGNNLFKWSFCLIMEEDGTGEMYGDFNCSFFSVKRFNNFFSPDSSQHMQIEVFSPPLVGANLLWTSRNAFLWRTKL